MCAHSKPAHVLWEGSLHRRRAPNTTVSLGLAASQQPGLLLHLLERPPLGQRGPRAPVALGPVERALDEPPVDPPLGPPRDLGPRARRPARQPVGRRDQPVGHRRRDRLGQDRARAARVAVEGAREAHRPFGGRRLMRFAVTLGPQNRGAGGAACALTSSIYTYGKFH